MTSHKRLNDSLSWRAVGSLKAGQSQVEAARWLQVDIYLVLYTQRHRRTLAPQLTRDLAVESGRGISRQTTYSGFAETILYAQRPVWSKYQLRTLQEGKRVLFCDESKFNRQREFCRVFIWRGSGAHFYPYYVTKIDIFSGNGILVRDCIVLGNRLLLYIFDAGTVN
ncbi:transposable element Tcb2 transposase [Trichonephila clavipes]|nr:transposable element Tcb2 transposase [Trichonephila clavipes]